MIVFGSRASAILFNFLKSAKNQGAFLLPVNICPIVISTFLEAKTEFEFVDISFDTFCIDEQVVLEKLSQRKYAGILFVRTYGTPASFEPFFRDIKKINKDIIIIDDNCLGKPGFTKIETLADMVLFSTGYSKQVDLGFGGFAAINDSYCYKTFQNNPLELDQINSLEYKNLDNYKTAVLSEYERIKKHKKKLNQIYTTLLPKEIQLPAEYQQWRFNILVSQKEKLLEEIFKQGLFASSHYAPCKEEDGNFPNAEYFYSKVVNLFNDKYFDEQKAVKLCQIVNEHVSRYS